MKKRLIAMCAALLSIAMLSPYTYAAKSISELKKEMAEREAQQKKTEKEINSKKGERDTKVEERNSLDLQISGIMEDIDDTQSVINEKQNEINQKNSEIDELNKVIDESNDKLKERMKVMYEYGSASYLELILEAKGLSDFFSRVSVVKDIVNHDKTLITTYVNAKTEVEDAKKVIETEKQEQIEAKQILQSKKGKLEDLQNQKDAVIKELNSDINELEKQNKQSEDDYNSLKSELQKALAEEEKKRKEAEKKAAAQKAAKQSSGSASNSTTPAVKGSGKFTWPSAVSSKITSSFGKRNAPNARATTNHRGIDIGAAAGSNVLAADSGTVVTAGYNGSYGYYVTINHGDGYVTLYAHNSRLLVSKGQSVSKGQAIAKVGSTGNSTGPHIHFEVMLNGVCQNPMNYF